MTGKPSCGCRHPCWPKYVVARASIPPIDQLLHARGITVCDLTQTVARRAGHLLARAKLSSAHAVDAFVVSTALLFDAAVIATGDPSDLERLAAPFRSVKIFAL